MKMVETLLNGVATFFVDMSGMWQTKYFTTCTISILGLLFVRTTSSKLEASGSRDRNQKKNDIHFSNAK